MGFWGDVQRGETHLDFVRLWRWGLALSAVLVLVAASSLLTRGLSLGIDFEGGTSWELPSRGVSVAEVRTALEPFGAEGAKIQLVGGETLRVSSNVEAEGITDQVSTEVTAAIVEVTGVGEGDVRVSRVAGTWEAPAGEATEEQVLASLDDAGHGDAVVSVVDGVVRVVAASQVTEITDALADLVGVEPSDVSVSTVGPTWGAEITRQAERALVFFFVAIALYITIRLEWKMAVGALVAVVHDIVITVGVYSVFQFEVTPATVIAFLTILGYSIYDTVVVYDKVRANTPKTQVAGKMTYTQMMNHSLNQVLVRSLNTTITSVLPVAALLVIGANILGAVTLQEFALALLVGLIVGAYSSVFIAAPVVTWLKEREPRNRQVRERLAARAGGESLADPAPVVGPTEDEAGEPEPRRKPVPAGAGPAGSPTAWPGGHPPRPRKKDRRRR